MVASFIFLGFINVVLCANKNERESHKPSDSDAYHVFDNYLNFDCENPHDSHHNGDGPSLFNSGLNQSDHFIELDRFIFHDQDTKFDQSIGHFDYMIPDSTTFEKDQELQLQVPINNFYSTSTPANQQSFMNQASFIPILLSQNTLNSDQNFSINNPQPFLISSDQIQEFQNRLIDPDLQLDRTKEVLTGIINPIHEIGMDLGNHEINMDLGDYKVNNGESNQFSIERKRRCISWKAYELNNLLKGVNEYGEHWKEILKSYKFGEERTINHLRLVFRALKRRGKLVHIKELGWRFVNRGELTDLMKGEEENEQIQCEKGDQRDAKLVNKSENDSSSLDQNNAGEVIENSDQNQEGLFLIEGNKKKRCIPWKRHEFINLIKGINTYGKNWKKIHELFKFEQGRTPGHLACRFFILKKCGQITLDEDSSWKFVNEKDSTHLDENGPSKAADNQRLGKGQNHDRPFFVEKTRKWTM